MNALTKEQALVISAYTGFLVVNDFSDLHEYVEKVMERPVWTSEFANKGFMEELREKLKPEFLKLIP
jgi:hypothetical protein